MAQAEQSQPPALWAHPGGSVTAAWVGGGREGVHQDARVASGSTIGDIVTLPIPPVHPYSQQLLPSRDDYLHLLWLDSNANQELRLYSALLSPDLTVERGPTVVSNQVTLHFVAAPAGDGQLSVIWSGGLPAEPTLYVQQIDDRGLPRPAVPLIPDATWPALVRANDGTLHLFWLRATDGTLHYGQLEGDSLQQVTAINHSLLMEFGDRLQNLLAGLDTSHLYLLWNITRHNGINQTWMMTRALGDTTWSRPKQIGIGEVGNDRLQTGLNTGTVMTVQPGDNWLRWAAPLLGQFDVLPVAGGISDNLVLVYLQRGSIAGYQRIAPVRSLVGAPILLTDRDRYLYLAWSEPLSSGPAELKFTTSRG